MDKKKEIPPVTQAQAEEKILERLKNRPNKWSSQWEYWGGYPKDKDEKAVKNALRKLVKKGLIRKKEGGYDEGKYLYYVKNYDVSYKDGIVYLSHPELGEATYNTITNKATLHGMKYTKRGTPVSLVTYFKGTTVGHVGERIRKYDDRKNILEDFRAMGAYGDFIVDHVIPKLNSHTGNAFKNMGYILPLLHKFENLYNWQNDGCKVYHLTEYKPSILPTNFRTMLKEQNILITQSMMEKIHKHPEYFKRLLVILQDEFIVNRGRDVDTRWHGERSTWSKILDSSELLDLVTQEGYDSRAIIRYLFNYLLPYEQLSIQDALSDLRDYASMHRQMGVSDFKRYPKYLKSNHDIIKGEFENFKQKIDAVKFRTKIREELAFKKMRMLEGKEVVDFVVEVPKHPNDVKHEGKELSHCVGSYIDRIMKGETQIVFLRKIEGIPYVTLEVREKVLIQAKGYANRGITKEEHKYINIYAKERDLVVRI